MKNTVLCATALATFCFFSSALADPADQDFGTKIDQARSTSLSDGVRVMDSSENTFGVYKLLPNVELKPANQVQETDRIGQLGDMAAVNRDGSPSALDDASGATAQNKVTMGSVLRNQITGGVAQATGSIAVLLNGGDIHEIASRHGLSIERSVPEINLYVLKARKDQDLLELRNALRQTEGVEAAKIDVLDDAKKPL